MTGTVGETVVIQELVESLNSRAAEEYVRYTTARELGEWAEALKSSLASFKLRAASLAISRRIVVPDVHWTDVSLVWRNIGDQLDAYLVEQPEDHQPESDYAAASAISEVLDTATAIEHEFGAPGRGHSPGLGQIIIAALQLGEEATVLELIAGDHWAEVAHLRTRQVGRQVGWSKRWNQWFAPPLQTWWESHPSAGMSELIEEALRLRNEVYPETRNGKNFEKVPESEGGMRAALKLMIERGHLSHPNRSSSK